MSGITSFFGELTFNKNVMKEKLSSKTFEKLSASVEESLPLSKEVTAEVAHTMKEWAISNGATHFTHWFQPLRGGTAEKHDAFITYTPEGDLIERFTGQQLIQGEPDASSFPTGGMRTTFEARGYTAWDPTSPAFLSETGKTKTLVIPSVFLSWTGEVLDLKTPFLRSYRILNDACIRLQRAIGNKTAKSITVNCGPEQEYFVVSQELFDKRPDLQVCGRTLFGAAPVKGQQMEDHYFGTLTQRMMRFMEKLDHELYRRGIPSKTRHNESAPNQFEAAVLYENANLAIDHNLQLMNVIKGVAKEHGLVVLLHEKPFAGLNGSGKHVNWSISDNTNKNYLEPSKSPQKNITFLLTLAAFFLGIDKYSGLLRAIVSDAGNDCRLGGNEAPPSIMSIYLGEYLTGLLDEIENTGKFDSHSIKEISMGVKNLPVISRDSSDRNRTSPIAFTGNKFEFRSVGSSQNPSEAVTVFNQLCAYGMYILERRIATAKSPATDLDETIFNVIRDVLKETRRVRFEGNGYSEEWAMQAKELGLPNPKNTPEALEFYTTPDVTELMEKTKVLSKRELYAKAEIKYETYVKTKEMEYKMTARMCRTMIMPAILKHLGQVSASGAAYKSVTGETSLAIYDDVKLLENLYTSLKARTLELEGLLLNAAKHDNCRSRAYYMAEECEPAMERVREKADLAETLIAKEFWPLPTYQDLLAEL